MGLALVDPKFLAFLLLHMLYWNNAIYTTKMSPLSGCIWFYLITLLLHLLLPPGIIFTKLAKCFRVEDSCVIDDYKSSLHSVSVIL